MGRILDQGIVQIVYELIGTSCALKVNALPTDPIVLGIGDTVEALGEVVSSLAKRRSFGCHCEIEPAAGIMVDAVILKEVQAAFRRFHPFGTYTIETAKIRERPSASSLHPYAFVGGIDITLPIEAGVYTAIHAIDAVFQPKCHTGFQLVLYPVSLGFEPFFDFRIH